MRGSADVAGMRDVRSRRAFFHFEIVSQNQPLEMKLESSPDFSHSDMHAARVRFFGVRFGRIFSLAFLSSSSVAAFRGPNSDSRNGLCFATSRQAGEIIAPEVPHPHAVFPSIRQDACWISDRARSCANASAEGERCMKDTVHPLVAFRFTFGFSEEPEAEEVTDVTTINLGADKLRIGLERPHFCARSRAQSNSWGRSSPTAR